MYTDYCLALPCRSELDDEILPRNVWGSLAHFSAKGRMSYRLYMLVWLL